MASSTGRYNLIIQLVALGCVVTLPGWAWALFFSSSDHEYTMALVLVPFLIALNLVLAMVVAGRDRFLQRVLCTALLFKVAAAGAYVWMVFRLYDQSADMVGYWGRGQVIANDLVRYGHWTTLHPIWSNNFIAMLTGLLFSVITVSLPAGVVVFAFAAFWGQYLFYRAFLTAFPEGDRKLAALLLFFLPSIVFWTATIGKDATILLFLGVTACGFAGLSRRLTSRAFVLFLAGLTGVMLVRPHVAVMVGLASLGALLLGQNRQGVPGVLGKLLGVLLLAGGTLLLARQAQAFLQMEQISQAPQVLERVASNNYMGGSAFGGGLSLAYRLVNVPFLFFRPWPWEVHSLQAVIAAAEGLLLLAIFVRRRRDFYAAVREWRSKPFVLFVVLFAFQFSVVMSLAITNFGLLTRERVMLMPFAMMLFCVRGESVILSSRALWYARRTPAGGTTYPAAVHRKS